MLFRNLGIHGWKKEDENLVLSSLLTGDPLLLIGNHGCAKTHLANKIGTAIGKKFIVYDASKAMFEDVLGYPNIEKLKSGVVEYVPSPVTVWDKELILIDELNRAIPELQSKWLEIIRSRKIMGFDTEVKWVWSAMNPITYSATQTLDDALIGRFATFIYPPDVLQMNEDDRIKVTQNINGDDAPSLNVWLPEVNAKTISKEDTHKTGQVIIKIISKAAGYFLNLQKEMTTLSEFLAKFADLLMRETNGEITLDGRRLGFIYRNILATRSIEMAKVELMNCDKNSFVESARYVVQSSIPVGLNDASINREDAHHKMEICFDLLSSYFDEKSEISQVNTIYELFTTNDLMRKTEILLRENLNEFVLSKAWTDLMNNDRDITLLAYTAIQIEARRPGTIPKELLEGLSRKISSDRLSSKCVGDLKGEHIEYLDEIEALLEREDDLEKIVAINRVKELVSKSNINAQDVKETEELIQQDIETFGELIRNGGEGNEDFQAIA